MTKPPRMSSDERREQIIDAAIAVFGARGYEGTTTDEIARAAGVSQPYVVRLFGSKEKLFLATLAVVLEHLFTAFRAGLTAGGEVVIQERMGLAYVDLLRVRGLHQMLSQTFLLGGHPVIGPAARRGFTDVWEFLRGPEVGMSAAQAHDFLAQGMLLNTMIGLRIAEQHGVDPELTEMLDTCLPRKADTLVDLTPRTGDPW